MLDTCHLYVRLRDNAIVPSGYKCELHRYLAVNTDRLVAGRCCALLMSLGDHVADAASFAVSWIKRFARFDEVVQL